MTDDPQIIRVIAPDCPQVIRVIVDGPPGGGPPGPVGPVGPAGATGPQGPPGTALRRPVMLVFSSGQSNMANEPPFNWSGTENLFNWNVSGKIEGEIGTAFVPLNGPQTLIGVAKAYTSIAARAHPETDYYNLRVAYGGASIHHWIGGLNYKWDAGTAEVDPGPGNVRLNHPDPTLVTKVIGSITDANGNPKLFGWAYFASMTYVRVQSVANPNNFVKYLPAGDTIYDSGPTTNAQLPVTYHSKSAGALVPGEAVKVQIGPDLYQMLKDNLRAGLSVLGLSAPHLVKWRQGENDASEPQTYRPDVNLLRTQMIADNLATDTTPWIVYGIISYVNGAAGTSYDAFNEVLQAWVAEDPNNRSFVADQLPAKYRDPASAIHLTGQGYYLSALQAYAMDVAGTGYKMPPGITYNLYLNATTMQGQIVALAHSGFPASSATLPELALGEKTTGFHKIPATGINFSFEGAIWANYTPGALSLVHVGNQVLLSQANGGLGAVQAQSFQSSAGGSQFIAYHGRGTTAGILALQPNDGLGEILFQGAANPTTTRNGVILRASMIDLAPDANTFKSDLRFLINKQGSVATDELMRLSHDVGIAMFGTNTVIDPSRHFRPRLYTRITLPTPLASNFGFAAVSNPEGVHGQPIYNNNSSWRYVDDNSAVTIS